MSGFLTRLAALSKKEALHMLRDRQMLGVALLMPVLLILLFGYAVSFDVTEAKVLVVDLDATDSSRALTRRLDQSDAFHVVGTLDRAEEVEQQIRRGNARAALIIAQGYAADRNRGVGPAIQVLVDGADATSARANLANLTGFVERLSHDEASAQQPLATARVRTWFNPASESALFVVPGLVAVILAILGVLLAALTVAREWERGSMEQLFATPADRLSVVLGKVVPYVALGLLQFLLVLDAGAWLFDVPLRGSFLILCLAVLLFLACVLGQGLMISMITKSQQLATQIGAVSAILPSLLLSGFIFPVENMPLPLQLISRIVPGRYLIVVLRGVLLQGRGLDALWPQLLGLVLLAIGFITLTTLRFRRRLD